MQLLTQVLRELPEVRKLLAAIEEGGCPAAFSGLSPVLRAYIAAAVRRETGRSVVLLCADETEGERLSRDLRALTGEEVRLVAAREFTFHHAAVVSRQYEHRRLAAFHALLEGKSPLTVVTVEALLQRTLPPEALRRASRTIRLGESYDLNELAEALSAAGYTRGQQVEGVGQFALRGGILDFFSPAQERPVRVEFFGDEADSMGYFDVNTQRRTEN